jgi:hypothetical protein
MKMGDTPVSCRKDGRGDFVTIADAIEALVARQPGLLLLRFPNCFLPMNANPSELT